MNPARPRRNVLGVHSWGLGQTFAEALRDSACERAWVVCGREGLDEISIAGETDVRVGRRRRMRKRSSSNTLTTKLIIVLISDRYGSSAMERSSTWLCRRRSLASQRTRWTMCARARLPRTRRWRASSLRPRRTHRRCQRARSPHRSRSRPATAPSRRWLRARMSKRSSTMCCCRRPLFFMSAERAAPFPAPSSWRAPRCGTAAQRMPSPSSRGTQSPPPPRSSAKRPRSSAAAARTTTTTRADPDSKTAPRPPHDTPILAVLPTPPHDISTHFCTVDMA